MQGLRTRSEELFDLFISYAHADDRDGDISRFVELLRQTRDANHYHSWQIFYDKKAIVVGDDWEQRLARVKSAGALIVLVSSRYFASDWCRKEWQGFREQEQKPPHLERIFPILLPSEGSCDSGREQEDWHNDLARRQLLDLRDLWGAESKETQLREALTRLERTISEKLQEHAQHRQFRQLTIPHQSIPLPPYFVPRPDDLNRVRHAILSKEAGPGLVMSAVFGMGGIGKTTLAADLVRQADVRDHFEDGILWATLGQNPEIRSLLSQWIVALGDHNFRSSEAGDYQAHLRTLLQSKKMLLVIDDAWSSDHVNWFRVGGERCRVLVTTRDQGIARSIHATSFDLDVMTPEQSLALITGRLGRPLRADEQDHAARLADDVGRLPLALELIASQVADGIPWDELREDLRREVARLPSLDLPDAGDVVSEEERKKRSLIASVNLSLGRLTAVRRERFAWLGVVPDDAVVNPVMTATLWNVDERTARDELRYLREKALLLAAPAVRIGEREHAGYRLHDLLHDTARHLLTSPKQPDDDRQLPGLELELPAAQAELLSRYRRRTHKGQWHTLPEEGYIHRRLAWHFEQARDAAALHALLREETATGRNGWFEANDRRGEMAVFADDVARAWRLAEEGWRAGQPAPVLGLQVRYALVTGSLNQMAGNLPPALIEALVQKKVWPPAQGLAYAKRIPEAKNRADALSRLTPLVPEAERGSVLAEALAAAGQIGREDDRSAALAALVPHLPEAQRTEVLAKAPAVVRQMGNRSESVATLAPHLPQKQQTEALAEALADRRQISDKYHRSEALAALAPHLSQEQRTEVLAEALAAAGQIDEEDNRSRALAALAPHLPETLLAEALAKALVGGWDSIIVGYDGRISEVSCRSRALAALAPRLTERLLAEALAGTRLIGDERDRSEALAALAPHLPETLLAEALATARQIRVEYHRSEALATLTPRLPEGQRREVLAEALAAAGQVRDEEYRSRALTALAGRLPEVLLTEALAAARQMSDKLYRLRTLAGFAPHLPEARLSEALADTRRISDEDLRLWTLAAFAPHLPEALLTEVLTAARQIRYESYRSDALAALAPHLPEGQRLEVLAEALAAARQIQDEASLSRVLVQLAPHLPETQSTLKRILRWAKVLARLAPHLPETLLAKALATARQIIDEEYRSTALAALAPRLTKRRRIKVLSEALATARKMIGHEGSRSRALAALAPQLPEAQRTEVLSEALAAARKISDESHRWRVLASLAPHVRQAQRMKVLSEALAAARQISDETDRSRALAALCPHLPEALAAAQQVKTEPHRSKCILTIISHRPSLSRDEQTQLLSESLRGLALQGRQPILEAHEDILRLLERLTGADVSAELTEIAHAIRDVGRWFP